MVVRRDIGGVVPIDVWMSVHRTQLVPIEGLSTRASAASSTRFEELPAVLTLNNCKNKSIN